MTTGSEWKVRRGGTLADQAVSVVDLFLLFNDIANNCRGVDGVGVPAVRIPGIGVREVGRIAGTDTRSGEESVSGRDDIFSARHGHWLLDSTHDGVNRSVQSKCFLDDSLVEGKLGKIFVGQRGQIGTESLDLFLVEFLDDLRVLGKAKHDPGAGRRRRVLTSHEQGNHHVSNLMVGHRNSVLVGRAHKMLHDVEFLVLITLGATLLDRIHINLGHSSLSVVALTIPRQRSPVQHEVDGGEAHIQIVIQSGKRFVKLVADGAALESMRGGEDGDLGHLLGNITNARLGLEIGVSLEVGLDFSSDDGNIGSEGIGGKSNLHEL